MNPLLPIACALLLFSSSGCQDPIRFAPSEAQKQVAELTYSLAAKIAAEGADPQSAAARRVEAGARASVAYMGRPAAPPDIADFDTVVAQAASDAALRPDPWSVADHLLELGIGIAGLVGGAYGIKAASYLRMAKEKSAALKEIVQGNELFLGEVTPKEVDKFKAAQAAQSPATRRIVTEVKAGAPA